MHWISWFSTFDSDFQSYFRGHFDFGGERIYVHFHNTNNISSISGLIARFISFQFLQLYSKDNLDRFRVNSNTLIEKYFRLLWTFLSQFWPLRTKCGPRSKTICFIYPCRTWKKNNVQENEFLSDHECRVFLENASQQKADIMIM